LRDDIPRLNGNREGGRTRAGMALVHRGWWTGALQWRLFEKTLRPQHRAT